MEKQIQPTVFVVMGRWGADGDNEPHIIGLVDSREKAAEMAKEALTKQRDPSTYAYPVRRVEAWIEGEYWVQ